MKMLLAVLLIFTSYCVSADVYKWTDKHGVVHYGDQPPASTDKNASAVSAVELSPIQISNNGTVTNPAQTPRKDLALPNNTDALSLKNWSTLGSTVLLFVEQWQQYANALLSEILAQIDIWRGTTPTLTNDNLNTTPATSAPTNKVEIYTAVWCGACKKAKQWLRGKNIPFQEYDVENDADAALRMQKLGGGGGIPFAVINGSTIEGFSAYRYSSALH